MAIKLTNNTQRFTILLTHSRTPTTCKPSSSKAQTPVITLQNDSQKQGKTFFIKKRIIKSLKKIKIQMFLVFAITYHSANKVWQISNTENTLTGQKIACLKSLFSSPSCPFFIKICSKMLQSTTTTWQPTFQLFLLLKLFLVLVMKQHHFFCSYTNPCCAFCLPFFPAGVALLFQCPKDEVCRNTAKEHGQNVTLGIYPFFLQISSEN